MLRMDCVPCLLSLIVIQSSLQFRPYHYDFMATHKLSFPSALFWTAENSPAKKRKKGPQCSTVLFEQYISDSTHIAWKGRVFFFFLLIQFHNPNFIFSLAPSFPDLPHGEIFICIYTSIHLIKMWLSMIYFVISLVLKQSHQQKKCSFLPLQHFPFPHCCSGV